MCRLSSMSTVFLVVLAITLSVQPTQAEDLPITASENVKSPVAEELSNEGQVEEALPLLEEGEEGEITERGVRRFKLKPRPGTNIQEKSRPRIKIPPPNSRKKVSPHKKFRLRPKGGRGVKKQPIYIPNQVIVKLHPGMSLPFSMMKKFGLQKLRTTSGGHILFQFAIPPGLEKLRHPLAVAQELARHAAVIYAEPNFIGQPDTVPQDPLFKYQWNYLDNGNGSGQSPGGIGLPNVWKQDSVHGNKIRGNKNVVVAVIDTGIVVKGEDKVVKGKVHPDIDLKKILPGFDFITDPFSANDGDGRDADPTDAGTGRELKDLAGCHHLFALGKDSWHGTSMAGIIGLGHTNNTEGIAGVNWEVSILPIRVVGKCGMETFDLYDAIRWAAGLQVPAVPPHLDPNPNPAKIINISLGNPGGCPTPIQEAIDEVVKTKDVSVVVAAGNEASLASFHWPSNCKNVISVAASDERGHLASYSNFGPAVTIMAPGGNRILNANKDEKNKDKKIDKVLHLFHPDLRIPKINDKDPKLKDILPQIKDIKKGYRFAHGTSVSTAHVSGVLALWLAEDFSLTHVELLKGLIDKARRDNTQCNNKRSCGAGLLNADLSSLIKPGKAVPPPPLKKGPPSKKEPPSVPQCTIKTTDIVHSLKIDIGDNDSQSTSAKQALFRMLIHGDLEARRDASGMIKATESGALAGIFRTDKQAAWQKAKGFAGQFIPVEDKAMCFTTPPGGPMIIYRNQEMIPAVLDASLRKAWHQCELPALPFPCAYKKNLGNKPSQTKVCLDQAEKAYQEGEKQCDAQFGNKKACQNAFKKCLGETGGFISACEERVPCVRSPDIQRHNACMKPFEIQRDQAEELCD